MLALGEYVCSWGVCLLLGSMFALGEYVCLCTSTDLDTTELSRFKPLLSTATGKVQPGSMYVNS